MSRLPAAFALAALAVLAAPGLGQTPPPASSPAPAKPAPKHDSNAPLDWEADRIEVQDRDHKATLVGNVRVVQQEMTLTADRVTALYTGSIADSQQGGTGAASNPKVQRLDANGRVVVTRPTEVAHGNYGIYDLDTKLITLIGNVSLDRNGSVVRGGRLVIDQNTNRATMDNSVVGNGGTATKGGRVSGRFIVNQKNDDGAATPTQK